MTDAISQYGRQGQLDSSVRSALDRLDKKVATEANAPNQAALAAEKKPSVAKPGADMLILSDVAKKAMDEPTFDRAKVESIKKAIQDGQYPLDSRRIAESFMAIERMIRD
ncbi:MAG: flagellar biosynthesis anti-sigma factor FlgM [Polaromonas sp.]|jgi:negative regulator of flagellin synthesis FlgM|nr:flagellar biosynthesis anti-sigma factor FlgM [Polaromonas sp.]